MNNTVLGIAILLGIIVLRWAVPSLWTRRRLHRFWNEGREALEAGDLSAAEAAFRRCVRMVPTAAAFHRMLGTVLAGQGKLEEAEERLRFGADLEPRNPAGLVDLGYFYALYHHDRDEDAVEAFEKALTVEPELREKLADEPRLAALRDNERFRLLLTNPETGSAR